MERDIWRAVVTSAFITLHCKIFRNILKQRIDKLRCQYLLRKKWMVGDYLNLANKIWVPNYHLNSNCVCLQWKSARDQFASLEELPWTSSLRCEQTNILSTFRPSTHLRDRQCRLWKASRKVSEIYINAVKCSKIWIKKKLGFYRFNRRGFSKWAHLSVKKLVHFPERWLRGPCLVRKEILINRNQINLWIPFPLKYWNNVSKPFSSLWIYSKRSPNLVIKYNRGKILMFARFWWDFLLDYKIWRFSMDIKVIPWIILWFLSDNMNFMTKSRLGHATIVKGNINSDFKRINNENYI